MSRKTGPVTMFWHGGSSYAVFDVHNADDAETFDSLDDAVDEFESRVGDRYYPMVEDITPDDGGPEAWIFYGKNVIGEDYPDLIIHFDDNGNVVVDDA